MSAQHWWILGGFLYGLAGIITMSWFAYWIGAGHVQDKHARPISDCAYCTARHFAYLLAFTFWWLWLIGLGLHWFVGIFERGGMNSRLPPNGSVDGRPKDDSSANRES